MDIQTNPATSMTVPFAERYDNFIGGACGEGGLGPHQR